VILERNHYSADKIPPHFFTDCVFEDVTDAGFAFLEKPNPDWANPTDCGDFPCTGPNQMVFDFTGNTYTGSVTPTTAFADFVMVPNDPTVGGTYPSCTERPEQQSLHCQIDNVGKLVFESLDDD